jgi:hypothetical protein
MNIGRLILAFIVLAGSLVVGCSPAPRSFDPPNPIPPQRFSQRNLDAILRAHVTDGVVDYPAIAADNRFQSYLRDLQRIDPNALPTRADRLAFWINAYNAFAIQGILDGYSPRTLFGRYRYFIARHYPVGGASINLYDLERKLLIPEFDEPRVHFAIVCASRSCPKLMPWVYTADRLEALLDERARAFVNDPSRNRFDRERKIAYLSKIFAWFEEDFTAEAGSLLRYVSRYVADPELATELNTNLYTIEFQEYDWSLNGIPLTEEEQADSLQSADGKASQGIQHEKL